MPLCLGDKLGPYEILAPIGAGGMGEVYRARDTRLGREVAIKDLPARYSKDVDRLRRFKQEARTVGMLNHPNILAIYDIGTHEGAPYLVSELLQGETLRERLNQGPLSLTKITDYGLQAARGLAAAHESGITHRDLKPENIFITKDGRVKILDFGLAKLTRPEPLAPNGSSAPTQTVIAETHPGTVLGTVGYMSPEQVRGLAVDHRSDIFALGAVLYEMLSGRRAFKGATTADTMTAILKEEAPEISATHENFSPALERIIRHCLEKEPEQRFQSAQDIAFDLEMLSGEVRLTTAVRVMPTQDIAEAALKRRRFVSALGALAVLAAVAAAAYFVGLQNGTKPLPSFQPLTFRRGTILSARFAPDGQTIVYGAAWDGKPVDLFSTRPESPESRSMGLPGTEILSISRSGEMAVSLNRHSTLTFMNTGTLARASLAGGASREILEDVWEADWGPGAELAIVRRAGGRVCLEFPSGKVLYETAGWITNARFSPKGDRIAFIDHPVFGDNGGEIAVVDLSATKKKTLSAGWTSATGLAWRPDGNEVWFTAGKAGFNDLHAVSLSGKERLVSRSPGGFLLLDISHDGRVLLTRDNWRQGMVGLAPGETRERDLSWFDWSGPRSISPDGRTILFSESGAGAGPSYAVYVRKTEGSPAVRIGEGAALALSPDGKWALSNIPKASGWQLALLPTGTGTPRMLEIPGLQCQWADFFPDGNRIVIVGNEPGHGTRLYIQDLAGGKPRPITPEGTMATWDPVSPDGRFVLARIPNGELATYSVQGGAQQIVPGTSLEEDPCQWSTDRRFIYVYRRGELPGRVCRLELTTGRKELCKEFMPADPAGIEGINRMNITPDGRAYVYSYLRRLSELFLAEGLR